MKQITSAAELRRELAAIRERGVTIGFVPTMGALHEGHLSLVRRSLVETSCTVVSIFVNPTQFGPNEDFSKYPRTLETDLDMLAEVGADFIFTPTVDDIYPAGASTGIDVGGLATIFEGEIRPGHYSGVCTVVASLFHIVEPDIAYFGQKDLQQVAVIKKMVRDLHIPVEIIVADTVREEDGLAMSSRNRYLSAEQRAESLVLYRTLKAVEVAVAEGLSPNDAVLEGKRFFNEHATEATLDYLALVDPETFATENSFKQATKVSAIIAARIGTTRLIDNIPITF
ncbi:MAG: pantoate--beta-alanine ligase [Bacteroidetes bacterium]|nr:pantoate--beta-alanine ligase [Bacteroidota bacterium]